MRQAGRQCLSIRSRRLPLESEAGHETSRSRLARWPGVFTRLSRATRSKRRRGRRSASRFLALAARSRSPIRLPSSLMLSGFIDCGSSSRPEVLQWQRRLIGARRRTGTSAEGMGRACDGVVDGTGDVEHRVVFISIRSVDAACEPADERIQRARTPRRSAQLAGDAIGDHPHSDVHADARGATGWKRKARKLLCRALPTGPARCLRCLAGAEAVREDRRRLASVCARSVPNARGARGRGSNREGGRRSHESSRRRGHFRSVSSPIPSFSPQCSSSRAPRGNSSSGAFA